ncbi:unnamed protein product [Allacma fusca]|uniref:Transmembrane protein n=1 Tax=Allacma fusca TaxID=39272 RepID=A0A8J2KIN6_9HEXA|nr:unnamed protein product [Allacma fusca]
MKSFGKVLASCVCLILAFVTVSADLNDVLQNAVHNQLSGIKIPNVDNMHGVSTYQKFPGGSISGSAYVSGTPIFKPEITIIIFSLIGRFVLARF